MVSRERPEEAAAEDEIDVNGRAGTVGNWEGSYLAGASKAAAARRRANMVGRVICPIPQ